LRGVFSPQLTVLIVGAAERGAAAITAPAVSACLLADSGVFLA
jgi:hypothetical protein